jgi:hypothetical protein
LALAHALGFDYPASRLKFAPTRHRRPLRLDADQNSARHRIHQRRMSMLRKFSLPLSLICVGAIAASLIACGSSSSSSKNNGCTGTYNVVGDWHGSVTVNGSSADFTGAINAAGDGAFVDSAADILTVGSLTGACSFSSTLGVYESIENPDGPATATGNATGNVTSASAINGSETTAGTTGTFSFTSYNPLGTGSVTGIPEITSAFYIEGQVEDYNVPVTVGGTSSSITVSGADILGCAFNGTFTEESTNNVYDVSLTISNNTGTTCEANTVVAGTYTGVGFESNSDILGDLGLGLTPTGPFLYAILTSGSQPFVMEVLPPFTVSGDRAYRPPDPANFNQIFGFSKNVSR